MSAHSINWILVSTLSLFVAPLAVQAFDTEPVKLDRLFTTAAERRELDSIRANYRPGDVRLDQPGVAGPQSLTVNGVVLRDSGRNVAWINGKSTLTGTPGDWQVKLDKSGPQETVRVPVSLSDTEQSFALQPGQTLETGTGRLYEAWQSAPREPKSVGR